MPTESMKGDIVEATIEKLDDNKIKVKATIPAADVDAALKSVYKELAGKYNFPGFRRGKAPRAVIDNALGAEVALSVATEDAVNKAYPIIIEEQELFPVGNPEFPELGPIAPGQDYVVEFTIGVKPEIELTSYEPLQIELPPAGVTEEDIDAEIEYLLGHYSSYDDAPEGASVTLDSSAELTISAKDDEGNLIDGASASKQFFSPGGVMYPDAFTDQIIGMNVGDKKAFDLDIAEDDKSVLLSTQAGKKVSFEVECNSIKQNKKPELTDEWTKETLDIDSVADLRKEIEETVVEQKAQIMPRIKENVCKVALVERVTDDVPENMAEEAEAELLQDFFTQLQQQGVTFDAYLAQRGIDSDQFKQDVKLQAIDEAKEQLALDAWARKNNITVSDDDILEEFKLAGVKNPAQNLKDWKKSGRLYLLREGIMRRKAMDNIKEGAVVTEVDKRKEESDK